MSEIEVQPKPKQTITIEVFSGNNFTVRIDDLFADRLCWDEMLGQIASLTHPKIKEVRYQMKTADEHAEWLARMSRPEDFTDPATAIPEDVVF